MKLILKAVLVSLATILLVACGATTGTNARSHISTFDGARIVSIDPHSTDCNMAALCSLLGATWSSNLPDKAMLDVEVMTDYTGIQSASLNIDGRFVRMEAPGSVTQFKQVIQQPGGALYNPGLAALGRRSSKGFVVPLELVREILAARDVRMRVATTDATIDSVVFNAQTDSKAHHALIRFMAQVDQPND